MSEAARERERDAHEQRELFIEIASAVLLALATVGAAWSTYQSNSWAGVQANSFSTANASRVESSQHATEAGQLIQHDLAMFTDWLNAFALGRTELQDFYRARFRDEFEPAFEAWLAAGPPHAPEAGSESPFVMPEYSLETERLSQQLAAKADEFTDKAHRANQRSNQYVLFLVLFASVLFFAGISTKFPAIRVRMSMLTIAFIVLVVTTILLAIMPVSISI